MTVQTEFFDYQDHSPQYSEASPNLNAIYAYLRKEFGGWSLGIYNRRRVGGPTSSWSTHASGAALDYRYAAHSSLPDIKFPGRTRLVNRILPFLVNNSLELGIQAIHDYDGLRTWRPPGTSGRPINGDGWRNSSGGDWQRGNTWIHIEVHPNSWGDDSPVENRIGGSKPEPKPRMRTMTTVNLPDQIKRGDHRRRTVIHVQKMVNWAHREYVLKPDGDYGPKTEEKVRNLQRWFQASSRPDLKVTGVVDADTWNLLIEVGVGNLRK